MGSVHSSFPEQFPWHQRQLDVIGAETIKGSIHETSEIAEGSKD